MPKISILGQKMWPTGREQTHTRTHRQTEKANTEDPFFEFFFLVFDSLLKERSDNNNDKVYFIKTWRLYIKELQALTEVYIT